MNYTLISQIFFIGAVGLWVVCVAAQEDVDGVTRYILHNLVAFQQIPQEPFMVELEKIPEVGVETCYTLKPSCKNPCSISLHVNEHADTSDPTSLVARLLTIAQDKFPDQRAYKSNRIEKMRALLNKRKVHAAKELIALDTYTTLRHVTKSDGSLFIFETKLAKHLLAFYQEEYKKRYEQEVPQTDDEKSVSYDSDNAEWSMFSTSNSSAYSFLTVLTASEQSELSKLDRELL